MKNIPNILSVIRICLVPVFIIVYFENESDVNFAAIAVYAIASATDILDGYLARRNNWISNLGRVLDPLGDKLMILAVITCITISRRLPPFVLILFAAKECCMLTGGLLIHKKYKLDMPASNVIGKVSTVLFFIVCVTMLIFPRMPQPVSDTMIMSALVVTFAALGSYIMTFFAVIQKQGK